MVNEQESFQGVEDVEETSAASDTGSAVEDRIEESPDESTEPKPAGYESTDAEGEPNDKSSADSGEADEDA